jgi:hypothetical protein
VSVLGMFGMILVQVPRRALPSSATGDLTRRTPLKFMCLSRLSDVLL